MALISLDIHVDRLDDVLSIFNRIEVYRSIVGSGGPFYEITDVVGPTSAIVDGTNSGTFVLNGETLEVSVDGATAVPVTFTGTDPLDLATVISQINTEVAGLASEVPTNTDKLRLTSPTTGTSSSIEVTAGTAATALGLGTDKVNGEAARIPLVDPTVDYNFKDLDGLESYFYKTRYSSTFSQVVSSFSDARQGSLDTVISASKLSKATIYLTDGRGGPVVGRAITFVLMSRGDVEGEYVAVPGFDARNITETNETGYAEIYLLRGFTYRVQFGGTNYQREFEVPDLAEFDVFDTIGLIPDPFDIVQPPPRPIKVS